MILQIRWFIKGLGSAYNDFKTSFNNSHQLLDEKKDGVTTAGVSLSETIIKACQAEQVLLSDDAVALKAHTALTLNPRKRTRGQFTCEIHGLCGYKTSDCIVKNPELEPKWRAKHPEATRARDAKKQKGDAGRATHGKLAMMGSHVVGPYVVTPKNI